MKQNIGSLDKIVRVSFSLIVAFLYLTNQITETTALVLGLLAGILLLTTFFGFCPIYGVCRISTRENKETTQQ